MFTYLGGYLQSFLEVCDVNDEPKNLEFCKSDLIIKFLIQINLPIQYLKHLTFDSIFYHIIPLLRILGYFSAFSSGSARSLMSPKTVILKI